MSDTALPGYEPMLAAYHRAFASELRAMLATLPIADGARVLDMACGDGVYSGWLAELGADVVAVDIRFDYLALARGANTGPRIAWAAGAIGGLPFPDATFDLAWCAQSLYSLPDPLAALRELARVTRPGGVVAVLEDDTLHRVLLPWPVEVELAIRRAEFKVLAEEQSDTGRFYIARRLRRVFREAGLASVVARTFAHDRAAPLDADVETFLAAYLTDLGSRVARHLDEAPRARLRGLLGTGRGTSLLADPDLSVTCLDHLVWGRTPGTPPVATFVKTQFVS